MSERSEACYKLLMEASLPPAEAEAKARELIAKGAEQTSAKYRAVAWLPAGETGLEALQRLCPGAARRILESAERQARDEYRRMGANLEGNREELDLRTFRYFRVLRAGHQINGDPPPAKHELREVQS